MLTPQDRRALPAVFATGKICVEIGVRNGAFAHIIKKARPSHLYLIDVWRHQDPSIYGGPGNISSNVSDEKHELLYQKVRSEFNESWVTIIREYSEVAVTKFSDNSVDFVYIDANHNYEPCYNDMINWWRVVRSGGWLCGHDWHLAGVHKAVTRFLNENKLQLSFLTSESYPSWGIIKV